MEFEQFDRQYLQRLNPQQREAVIAVDGPVLILATPGSGKTTVLVTRLGYMTLCCGIDPRSILTVTYTRAATRDMRMRFAAFFGEALTGGLQFRTINGLSARIIHAAGSRWNREPFALLEDGERAKLLRDVWRLVYDDYPEESDVRDLSTAITYIKNMMLPQERIGELRHSLAKLPELYRQYNAALREMRMMDYDDQMVYALTLLRKSPELLDELQTRYSHLCVDEAQDSSRVQHEIIRLLSRKSENLFMVGDEDQSIYGFRAAWPDALVGFREEHPGSKVLLIEENYRSTPEIIDAANRFVAKNRFRHPKRMIPTRGSGAPVHLIQIASREDQIRYLLKAAPDWDRETAILFRNNDSALPLIDRLEAIGLPYNCRNFEDVFFSHHVVTDILDMIRFASEPANPELFLRLYYKFGIGISKADALWAVEASAGSGAALLSSLQNAPGLKSYTLDQVILLNAQLRKLRRDHAETALHRIWESMHYGRYVQQRGLDSGKYYILRMLAAGLPDIRSLTAKLDRLKALIASHENRSENLLILSTIHSSKGLEYDRVYLLDMLTGILPAKEEDACLDEEERRVYEEERRLFYVGMTRARNELFLFRCGAQSAFPEEVALDLKRETPCPGSKDSLREKKSSPPDDTAESFLTRVHTGSEVTHRSFGKGTVVSVQGDTLWVDFPGKGKRRLSVSTSLRFHLLR